MLFRSPDPRARSGSVPPGLRGAPCEGDSGFVGGGQAETGGNPKTETRSPKEGRSPKAEKGAAQGTGARLTVPLVIRASVWLAMAGKLKSM